MNKKTIISEYIETQASTKEIEFIYNLISLRKYPNKINLLAFINDNPIPNELYKEVESIYKNIYKANLVFDYKKSKFGELLNINEVLINYIVRLKNNDNT